MNRYTIISSQVKNCLNELVCCFSLEEQNAMQVEEGYHDKLTIDEEVWNSFSDQKRHEIYAYADGFVQGFECNAR